MTPPSRLAVTRARLRDERGFTLLEALAALLVLAVGAFAIAQAVGFGLHTTGMSRQRLAARAAGEQQLELARSLNYDSVVLDDAEPIPHVDDPDHPNYWVDEVAQTFDPDGDGPLSAEPIVRVAGASPALHHVQSPFYAGNTRFEIYLYVTWVDAPADGLGASDDEDGDGDGLPDGQGQDQKRVTVAIRWQQGSAWRVERMASLFSDGEVPYHESAGSASPSPSSSPSASPSEVVCPPSSGPATGPGGSVTIASGATYTTSQIVTLTFSATGAASYRLSSDGQTWDAEQPYTTSTIYTLPAGDGTKTVWVCFYDASGVPGQPESDTIVLDTAPPNGPTGLTASRSANKKEVTLSWSAPSPLSSDHAGYRVYRRPTTGSTWVPVSCQFTGPTTCVDDVSGQSGYQRTNYEYYVVAYDLAGNESVPSNSVTV